MSEKVTAMTMSNANPLYVRFQKNRDKIVKKIAKKTGLASEEQDSFYFLCYVTRSYFKDCALISLAKLALGVAAIVFAVLMEHVIPVKQKVKGPAMVLFFTYGIVMVPLSIMYIIANLVLMAGYLDYVSTPTSVLSHKIISFYDEDTDKFVAVNWGSIFKRDGSVYKERKRKRGW